MSLSTGSPCNQVSSRAAWTAVESCLAYERVRSSPDPMVRGNGVEAAQTVPPTVPDENAVLLGNKMFPVQVVTSDGNRRRSEGVIALQKDAWTNIEAEAKAQVAVAKARKANAEASLAEAEVEAKAKVADAEAQAKAKIADAEARTADAEARVAEADARVAEAQAATKIRVAAAEAREADLKILKLGKEIDVFTGECEVYFYCLSVRLSVSLSLPFF